MRAALALILTLLASPTWATVAFDVVACATPGTGNLTWTHTPSGTPRGVVVYVIYGTGADEITSIDYGASSMTEVSGSPNIGGESATVAAYFLGASVPTGAQTVTVTVSGASNKAACSFTVTGAADMELVDVDATINSTAATDPSVTMSLAGKSSFVSMGFESGHNVTTACTPFTNWTERHEIDHGSELGEIHSYDIIGTSDVTAGWTQTIEDALAIVTAITEVSGAARRPGMVVGHE